MRFKRLFLLRVCMSGAAVAGNTVIPPAVNMTPAVYDDGKSCPNDCDAHVVFHPRHNGTADAYDPSGSRARQMRRGAAVQDLLLGVRGKLHAGDLPRGGAASRQVRLYARLL